MSKKPQWQMLVEYLEQHPEGRTIKQVREDLWIQNLPDAAMQARRHGRHIETVYLHDNKKIASYRLEKGLVGTLYSVTVADEINAATGEVISKAIEGKSYGTDGPRAAMLKKLPPHMVEQDKKVLKRPPKVLPGQQKLV